MIASQANEHQLRVITAPPGRARKILAGAGTGKTFTMVERFAHLVETRNLDPSQILAVTFTNKAAGELKERIGNRLLRAGLLRDRAALDQLWVGTFHGLCARLLRENAYEVGFDRDLAVISELDERLLVEEVATDLRNGRVRGAGILEIEALLAEDADRIATHAFGFIKRMKSLGLSPEVLENRCLTAARQWWEGQPESEDERIADDEAARLICSTYHEYERRLRERRLIDFDGIMLLTRAFVADNPAFQQRCRQMFRQIMVDEFQDTNHVQAEVIALLAAPGQANVEVVGDAKQSIYGWRDADIRNILDFEGDTHPLPVNYRSPQTILDAADNIIRKDPTFANEPRLEAIRGAGADDSFALFKAGSPEEEARFVASRIVRLHAEGHAWREFAILTRMAKPPIAFEQELRRAGIPYVAARGYGFFERQEIQDVMAYLRVAHDPLDDRAVVRLLQGPVARVSDAEMFREFQTRTAADRGLRLWDAVVEASANGFSELLPDTAARISATMDAISALEAILPGATVADLVDSAAQLSGYKDLAGSDSINGPRRLANLRKLFRMASDYEASAVFSGLTDFIRYVDLHGEHAIDVPEADLEGLDAVSLMTVHAAKGLEFPIVFLAHIKPFRANYQTQLFYDEQLGLVVKRLTPVGGKEAKQTRKYARFAEIAELPEDRERSEMRRLIYVGMTRAQDRLFVSTTRKNDRDLKDDYFQELEAYLEGGGRGIRLDGPGVAEIVLAVAEVDAAQPREWWPSPPLPQSSDHELTRSVVPLEVSFTSLETMAECPLRFRYIHEWKIPTPRDSLWPRVSGSDEPRAIRAKEIGSLVHLVLEAFHQPGREDGAGGLERLQELWTSVAVPVIGSAEAGALWSRSVSLMMATYIALPISRLKTIATEYEFHIRTADDTVVHGFVDRLAQTEAGGVVLVDYKTSAPGAVHDDYERQMRMYLAAMAALGTSASAALVWLRGGAVDEFHREGAAALPVIDVPSPYDPGAALPADRPCGDCSYRHSCPGVRVPTRRPG